MIIFYIFFLASSIFLDQLSSVAGELAMINKLEQPFGATCLSETLGLHKYIVGSSGKIFYK